LDFGGETLGQRLARLRKQHGFTQVELAEKVGITQVLISAYETDRACFAVEMAVRFAMTLGSVWMNYCTLRRRRLRRKNPTARFCAVWN